MSMKEWRINYRTVGKAVKDATKRNLSRAGRYLMNAARWSLKARKRMALGEMPEDVRERYQLAVQIAKRKGEPKPKRPWAPSEPRDPPRVRKASPLKKLLLYAYSSREQVVRIGPAGLRGSDVPHVLEFGGTADVHYWVGGGPGGMPSRWHKGQLRQKRVRVAKRPYMGPALKKALPKIEPMWRDSIRG